MAKNRIFALSLGSQQVTGAIFSKTSGGGLKLERVERKDLVGDPSEEDARNAQAGQAIRQIVNALKVKGESSRYVISSLPVLIKFASLPALDGSQVDQIVEFEAAQQVPYPINEVVWGYQLMGNQDDVEMEVVLAAVKADELGELDALVSDSGLRSEGAAMSPVALFNALRFNYPDLKQEATLLVDIGARMTDMIFMEGNKLFIRTVKIGGSDLSRTIAKEFGMNFATADARKVLDGFVALGGPYADHEDPEIAAMSKVVRQSLTRLHSEVMRTINFYRSQQGGSAPTSVLLSGATASLPFIREFFAEKLNLPVDYFNPFRNVTVANGATMDTVLTKGHMFGDLVGCALAGSGAVPVQIDLLPESVVKRRDLDSRKFNLVAALVLLTALLCAMGFYFSNGAVVAENHAEEINKKAETLAGFDKKIVSLEKEISSIDGDLNPYIEAIRHRAYWVRLFNYLGRKMENDVLFMTLLEPLSGGQSVVEDSVAGNRPDATSAAGAESSIDAFQLQGLWRENPHGSKVVYEYFQRLKSDAETDGENFFALKDLDISEAVTVDAGTSADRFAYTFKMILPLPEANRVRYTK